MRRWVDDRFERNSSRRGQVCEWPVLGGTYVSGFDPIEAEKEKAVQALVARQRFARSGPPDAPPLASQLRGARRAEVRGRR